MNLAQIPDGARLTWVTESYDTARQDPIPYQVEHTGRLISRDLQGGQVLLEEATGARTWVAVARIRAVQF